MRFAVVVGCVDADFANVVVSVVVGDVDTVVATVDAGVVGVEECGTHGRESKSLHKVELQHILHVDLLRPTIIDASVSPLLVHILKHSNLQCCI